MATIPIEVIVQDVEAPANPTPTPETNETITETNIAVPNTGAEALGNNTFSSPSVASIIVPVVLLALALATICTLFIRRHKHQDSKVSKKEKLAASISTVIAVLSATALIGNLIMPATKAATSDTEVSIEAPDKISIVINREDDTTEAATETTAYITSTSTFGYKVLLSMADGADTANLYLDGDTTSEYYIAPVEAGELGANNWGYALADEEVYNQVPLLDTPATVAQGEELVENEELTIYYGIDIDKSLPEGTYTSNIEYIITAQEPTLPISYMQDFATLSEEEKTALLESMSEGEQYTLKDTRDNKSYYVSKLADGNVWMTQNLDFDLNIAEELTPTDTDITESWRPDASTHLADDTIWDQSYSAFESYDPGDLYWNGQVSNNWAGNLSNMTVADPSATPGGRHYHIGNYYSWHAAVAANNSDPHPIEGQDTNRSICPAGWRLPSHGGNKSYENLISLQKLTHGQNGNIQNAPAYFLYSASWNGTSGSVGVTGNYWSSSQQDSQHAYHLGFSFYQLSYDSTDNYGGYSVRCVAR